MSEDLKGEGRVRFHWKELLDKFGFDEHVQKIVPMETDPT